MGHGFTILPYVGFPEYDLKTGKWSSKPIHTSVEAVGYVIEVDDDTTFAAYTANGNKTNTEILKMGGVVGASVLTAGTVLASTKTDSTPTPIMIYAKKYYGIEYADFTDTKFNTKAKIDLGINDKNKLIEKSKRETNFKLFEKNHFSPYDEFDDPKVKPKSGMSAYAEIEKYALSDYGSLMIKKIINNPQTPKFHIGVANTGNIKAHGQYERNFIALPKNFPSAKTFAVSKQKISGVAILHHEFEHTQHGKYKNIDRDRNIMEEWRAVRYSENPVRILNGLEPRYVYYQNESNSTINILNNKEIKQGKWTYNKDDPSKPMVEVK